MRRLPREAWLVQAVLAKHLAPRIPLPRLPERWLNQCLGDNDNWLPVGLLSGETRP